MMRPTPPSSALGRLLAFVGGAVLLVVGFMFSLVVFAVIAAVGLVVFAWFWWKTRALRKEMRERPPGGNVIEGEATVVDEAPVPSRQLPRGPGSPDSR